MARVKSAAAIAEKWSRVAPTRQQDYESGIKDPGVDWQRATEAGRESYEAGVQEAIQRNAFSKGVAQAGNAKWADKTVTVGAGRWTGGIRAASGDYEKAMEPVVATIERVVLPPRGPRGDPRNYQRAEAMGRALSEARRRA
jgi:hypothetical protein